MVKDQRRVVEGWAVPTVLTKAVQELRPVSGKTGSHELLCTLLICAVSLSLWLLLNSLQTKLNISLIIQTDQNQTKAAAGSQKSL